MAVNSGTGVYPVIARIAKVHGYNNCRLVTIPFIFEENRKLLIQALDGANALVMLMLMPCWSSITNARAE